MQCGQNVQLFDVELLVHHVTSSLLKVKALFMETLHRKERLTKTTKCGLSRN